MKPDAQERLVGNIVASMSSVARDIQGRQIRHFYKADPNWGQGLGVRAEEVLNGELATTVD
jgi:catalase